MNSTRIKERAVYTLLGSKYVTAGTHNETNRAINRLRES